MGDVRAHFMSVIGSLPENIWFCYNSLKFDGSTRSAPKWSVASVLDIDSEVVVKGVNACNYFKSRGGTRYEAKNTSGRMIFVHKTMWGTDVRDGKKVGCRWLSVGAAYPTHTPPDQCKGLMPCPILSKTLLQQVHEWGGIILKHQENPSTPAQLSQESVTLTTPVTPELNPLPKQASKKRKAMFTYSTGRYKNARTDKLISVIETESGVDSTNPEQWTRSMYDVLTRTSCLPKLMELELNQNTFSAEASLKMHFKCNLSYNAMRPALQVMRQSLPNIHVASMKETRDLRDKLIKEVCPAVRTPPPAVQQVVGDTARYTRVIDFTKAVLQSPHAQSHIEWKCFSGQVVLLIAIDFAWVTGAGQRGLEIGFATVANLTKIRNNPYASGLVYLSEVKESQHSLYHASKMILEGLENGVGTVQFNCTGRDCSFCKFCNIMEPTETHVTQIQIFGCSDDKATHELMGVAPTRCYICAGKYGSGSETIDTPSGSASTSLETASADSTPPRSLEDYETASEEYFALYEAFDPDGSRSREYFMETAAYKTWKTKYAICTGPCALVQLRSIANVRWCFLHMCLRVINTVLEKTFYSYATQLEADNKGGVDALARSFKKIGLGTRGATILRKYQVALEEEKLTVGPKDFTSAKSKASTAGWSVKRYLKIRAVTMKTRLIKELLDLNQDKQLKDYKHLTVYELKPLLEAQLITAVKSGVVKSPELLQGIPRRLRSDQETDHISSDAHASTSFLTDRKILEDIGAIIGDKDGLLGGECMKLLKGYREVAATMNSNILRLRRRWRRMWSKRKKQFLKLKKTFKAFCSRLISAYTN
eukprot:m.449744 g.449744  ORF g.449744 m.449744 type:complete len:822 (+) comp21508_c0_seq24:140-2605(+)